MRSIVWEIWYEWGQSISYFKMKNKSTSETQKTIWCMIIINLHTTDGYVDARVTRQVKGKLLSLLTVGAFVADGEPVTPGVRNHIGGQRVLDTNVSHASTLVTLLGSMAVLLKMWHGEDAASRSDGLLEDDISTQLWRNWWYNCGELHIVETEWGRWIWMHQDSVAIVMPLGEQSQGGAWQASPCWRRDLDASSLHRVWFRTTVCGCLLCLASFCDSSQICRWSHPFSPLDANWLTSRKWSSTHPCSSSTLLWYVSVIVSHCVSLSCYPFCVYLKWRFQVQSQPSSGQHVKVRSSSAYYTVWVLYVLGLIGFCYDTFWVLYMFWDSLWAMLPIQ